MALSTEEVRHIAALCRIGLTSEEVERLGGQLSDILAHVSALQEVDTEGVPPTSHSVELRSVMREDETGAGLDAEEALANAPRRIQDYFKVNVTLEG